jgi:hypothetical protein
MAAQKAIKESYDQYICVPEMIGYNEWLSDKVLRKEHSTNPKTYQIKSNNLISVLLC